MPWVYPQTVLKVLLNLQTFPDTGKFIMYSWHVILTKSKKILLKSFWTGLVVREDEELAVNCPIWSILLRTWTIWDNSQQNSSTSSLANSFEKFKVAILHLKRDWNHWLLEWQTDPDFYLLGKCVMEVTADSTLMVNIIAHACKESLKTGNVIRLQEFARQFCQWLFS